VDGIGCQHPLAALDRKEALILFRSVAREKALDDLASHSDDDLTPYCEKMFRYPLVIKWVLGQLTLGRDLGQVLSELSSPESYVATFFFKWIFDHLGDCERVLLFALSTQDDPLPTRLLCELSNLPMAEVDSGIQKLTRASLVVSVHRKMDANPIETRYDLLPLTKTYVRSRPWASLDALQEIETRIAIVRNLLDEEEQARKEYKYSPRDLGAKSEHEKAAAAWAIIGYQKFDAGEYASAVAMFEKAVSICPTLPMIRRNWAKMEMTARFYDRALDQIKLAARLAPNDERVWREWASIEMKKENYDSALEKVSRGLAIEPEDFLLWQLQGEIEKRRRNYEDAERLLRHALERASQPGVAMRHQAILRTTLASTLRNWAEELRSDGGTELALAKLSEAYRLAKDAFAQDGSEAAASTLREASFDLGEYTWAKAIVRVA
jgi:tetratricopeptide (TPR) repeat protein